MVGEYLREAYPLTWPERQARTPPERRRVAKFTYPLVKARDELLRELKLLGAQNIIISSNVPVRRDGLPLADAREPNDPAVAVYFERSTSYDRKKQQRVYTPFVIACDSYQRVKWNLRAVGVTVESLRAIERHGSTSLLEQAFTGFAALPPASGPEVEPPWWVTLGVPRAADPETVKAAYRALVKTHHPDAGGDPVTFARIARAYTLATGAAA